LSTRDTPGVIAPPPLIYLAFLLAGWGLGQLIGEPGVGLESTLRRGLAFALVLGGLIVEWAAVASLRRLGTPPEPWKTTTALATGGLYGLSRNPIYQGFTLIYVGFGVAMDSPVALAFIFPCLIVIDRFVIAREEVYLARKFGPAWTDYAQKVRRWL
jgi:protein-S-isoprenylcysteine O-methyltransferase Ste14